MAAVQVQAAVVVVVSVVAEVVSAISMVPVKLRCYYKMMNAVATVSRSALEPSALEPLCPNL